MPIRKQQLKRLWIFTSVLALVFVLQETLDNQREAQDLMGVSAAVIVPAEGFWLGVSGLSDPTVQDSIRPDMLFGVGSITKTFTSAVILQLAQEEVLSLDDSLYSWLPSHEYIDSTITIRQLLNHTSGIFNYTNNSLWRYNSHFRF